MRRINQSLTPRSLIRASSSIVQLKQNRWMSYDQPSNISHQPFPAESSVQIIEDQLLTHDTSKGSNLIPFNYVVDGLYPLNRMDSIVGKTGTSTLYTFKASSGSSLSSISSQLKSSLIKLLSHCPILCGRLVESPSTGLLSVKMSNSGIGFVHQRVNNYSFLDKSNLYFSSESSTQQPFPFIDNPLLIPHGHWLLRQIQPGVNRIPLTKSTSAHSTRSIGSALDSANSLCNIQLTEFPSDNSLTIGIACHHSLLDAKGQFELVRMWNQIYNGKEKLVKINHDRSVLMPKNQAVHQYSHPCYGIRESRQSRFNTPDTNPTPLYTDLDVSVYEFFFSANEVKKIKSAAETEYQYDALCAWFWLALRRAEARAGITNPSRLCGFAIDGRSSFHRSEINSDYLGNVLYFGLITSNDGTDLKQISRRFRTVINETRTEDYVYDRMRFFNSVENVNQIYPLFDFVIASGEHFPGYNLDFNGGLGKPVNISIPYVSYDEVNLLFQMPRSPYDQPNSMRFIIGLPSKVMKELRADKLFRQFAETP